MTAAEFEERLVEYASALDLALAELAMLAAETNAAIDEANRISAAYERANQEVARRRTISEAKRQQCMDLQHAALRLLLEGLGSRIGLEA